MTCENGFRRIISAVLVGFDVYGNPRPLVRFTRCFHVMVHDVAAPRRYYKDLEPTIRAACSPTASLPTPRFAANKHGLRDSNDGTIAKKENCASEQTCSPENNPIVALGIPSQEFQWISRCEKSAQITTWLLPIGAFSRNPRSINFELRVHLVFELLNFHYL